MVVLQVKMLLQGGGGGGPVIGRIAVSGDLQLLKVAFIGRRLAVRVLTDDMNTTTAAASASGQTLT